jgi:3-hydroxybutyryl-CoA dehydratase
MSVWLDSVPLGATVAEAEYAPFTRDDLKLYARASGDLNPLHLDTDFANQAGFADVIVHGMLGMALLGRLLSDAFPSYRLQLFGSRFRNVIPLGESIRCVARLEGRRGDASILTLTATVGAAATVVIEGSATLCLDATRRQ